MRGIGANFAAGSLPSSDDWLTDPLFWFGIVGPVSILAIAALYFVWIDFKTKKLSRHNSKKGIR